MFHYVSITSKTYVIDTFVVRFVRCVGRKYVNFYLLLNIYLLRIYIIAIFAK